MFVALLGTVTDGSQLALELWTSDNSDGSSGAKVGGTATVTAATSSNKSLVAEVSYPNKRYVFARVKRGTQNAAIQGVLAIQHFQSQGGADVSDSSVLATATHAGPALNPATSLLPAA